MRVIEISCIEVWREISRYLDAEVDPDLRARMAAHFKVCHHCRAILDGTNNVIKLIADGEPFEVPAEFSKRLFNKLR
jgi:predicted anti-sigma-YlaC factor YlaD